MIYRSVEDKMITRESLETVLRYYTQQGVMSDPGTNVALYQVLSVDVAEMVCALQGLLLHVYWAERYGVLLSDERKTEVSIRTVRGKLKRLFVLDDRPLNLARPAARRLVGNCRDFSLLLVSFLKSQGIPARARCGFGTYFMPDHYEDHWMVEYWSADDQDPERSRWVQVDAQLDELQQQVLKISFNPLDMPKGQFVLAGQAWQMCRRNEANPDDFGIFEWHGMDFIKGNLMRDFLSLNRMETLPWDDWGLVQVPFVELTPQQLAYCDHLAELTLSGNEAFEELRRLYEEDPSCHVPEDWWA
jgi:hypothetical protein